MIVSIFVIAFQLYYLKVNFITNLKFFFVQFIAIQFIFQLSNRNVSLSLPIILVFALSIAALFIAQMHVSCSALAQHFPTIRMRIAANDRACCGGI